MSSLFFIQVGPFTDVLTERDQLSRDLAGCSCVQHASGSCYELYPERAVSVPHKDDGEALLRSYSNQSGCCRGLCRRGDFLTCRF